MNAAADKEEFEAAEEHKMKLESVSKAAELEHKLYRHCQWAVKYANKKLEELKNNRMFIVMKNWTPLHDAANNYLKKLSDEDVAKFEMKDELTKSNEKGTVISTEAPSGEAPTPTPGNPTTTAVEEVTDSAKVVTTDQDSTKSKSKAARKRSSKGYTPAKEAKNASVQEAEEGNSSKNKKKKKDPQKPLGPSAVKSFIKSTKYRVNHPKGGVVYVDVTSECYTMSNGSLYCECCNKVITWDNRTRHMVAEKHIANKQAKIDVDNSAAIGRVMLQQRIELDSLVGKTYDDEKCEAILMWLKIACKGNWSLRSIELVQVR